MSKLKKELENFSLVTIGSIIYAIGIACFLDPLNIAPGGVAGIAMVLGEFIPVETGMLTFILNVPILVAGFIRFRGRYMIYTLYALAFSSWIMDEIDVFLPEFVPVTDDLMLAALAGSVAMAAGTSLVYLGSGSTGGMDIVIKFLRQKYVHMKTGTMTTVSDLIICAASCVVFGNIEIGLYGVVTLFINGKTIDYMLYGGNEAKLIFVVSKNTKGISDRLLSELEIGVTWLEGVGAYTGVNKQVIFTTFRKQVYHDVREIVKGEDPEAFMIVTSASEIFGEGFKDHFADEI